MKSFLWGVNLVNEDSITSKNLIYMQEQCYLIYMFNSFFISLHVYMCIMIQHQSYIYSISTYL
jgi:hypothetical protein